MRSRSLLKKEIVEFNKIVLELERIELPPLHDPWESVVTCSPDFELDEILDIENLDFPINFLIGKEDIENYLEIEIPNKHER